MTSRLSVRTLTVLTAALCVSSSLVGLALAGPASPAVGSVKLVTPSPVAAASTAQSLVGYDIVYANGGISNRGGAIWYGSARTANPKAPIVSMAMTPDDGGYFEAAFDGEVFAYGDAHDYGSLTSPRPAGHGVVAIASSPDGKGYWLIDQKGVVTAFGDARPIRSLAFGLSAPIIGAAVTPSGTGAWLITAQGNVECVGTAVWYGSLYGRPHSAPISSITRTPVGAGYYLTESNGTVVPYGDAHSSPVAPGSLRPGNKLTSPAIGIATEGADAGYWVVGAPGGLVAYGHATTTGTTVASPGSGAAVGVVAATTSTPSPWTGPVPSPLAAASPAQSLVAYDVVYADGGVANQGGAIWYGSARFAHPRAPIVSMAMTPDNGGYFEAASDGEVFAYGDAHVFGTLASPRPAGHGVAAIASSPDGKGYWLIDQKGDLTAFGDAGRIASFAAPLSSPIIGAAVTRGGTGAWLITALGNVDTVGTAPWYGSLFARAHSAPISSITPTPTGKGYYLTESNGTVVAFGDATSLPLAAGSLSRASSLASPAVGIATESAGEGYWVVGSPGGVVSYGGATTAGASPNSPAASPAVGIVATTTAPSPWHLYPSGSIGYDVNWPQCNGALPGPPTKDTFSYTIAIVGVDGWGDSANNRCLATEARWAARARTSSRGAAPYQLYMFLNSYQNAGPGGPAMEATGPGGTCAKLSGTSAEDCRALNYGSSSAARALAYASSKGAHASIWWLDIEGPGTFWLSGSTGLPVNARTIQGAIDRLRIAGVTAGIYSTHYQYNLIAGSFVPAPASRQIPIWVAGAYWTNPPYPSVSPWNYHEPPALNERTYCQLGNSNPYVFAGGKVVMLQETPGPNGYPYDPNYAC